MPKKARAASEGRKVATEDYNAVVANATLRNIRLLSSSFEALPEAFKVDGDERANGVGYELLAHRYDRETNRLTGMFGFNASSSSGDQNILTVEGEYLIDYELSAPCDEDAAALFIERLGPFAAYPYFRALVALLTGQAGLVSPPLPILAEAPRPISRAKEVRFSGENATTKGSATKKRKPLPSARPVRTPKRKSSSEE
jgi:hypothetical protein